MKSAESSSSNIVLNALEMIDGITQKEIDEFTKLVLPSLKDAFKTSFSEKEKLELVALHELSEDELYELVRLEIETGKIVGFHEIMMKILKLYSYTGLPKYNALCDRIENNFC